MSEELIITWMNRLANGDGAAAEQLWREYYERLVCFARAKWGAFPRRVADEEDIALSAIQSFCERVKERRFPKLHDRNNLWNLLTTITARKLLNLKRDANRKKRGGGSQVSTSYPEQAKLEQILGNETSPEFVVEMREELERLLSRLESEALKEIALLKLSGHTNAEIAEKLDCSMRRVERKLQLVRKLWNREEPDEQS